MGEILFLAHRMPFPPNRGDKIRSHYVLKALAALAPVHVATFADSDDDLAHEAELAALAASHVLARRIKPLPLAGLEALARRQPVSVTAFHDARIEAYVRKVLAQRAIAAIYVFSGQMGQYVPEDFRGRVLADLVDVDSAKFAAYARRGNPLARWINRREERRLAIEEARIAARADVTMLISREEAELFRSRMRGKAPARAIAIMGNGVDTDYFARAAVTPEPGMIAMTDPRLIFTGQMDYPPNAEAALRAIREVLPRVRARLPGATLHIVGRNPGPELRARDGGEGVSVWGEVADIRPWLAASDLALVPLAIARGVQNKVLEAMAMGLPTVLTSGAAAGIPARDGRDFLVADSDEDLARGVCDLAGAPDNAREMGAAAAHWVRAHAGWPAALAPLHDALGPWLGKLPDAA